MEKKLIVFMAAIVLSAGVVHAEEMKADAVKVEEMLEIPADGGNAAPVAVEVDNKICPISGEAIVEGEGEKVTVNGKIYNVCKIGKAEFDKDPAAMAEKFAAFEAKMAEEVVKTAIPMAPVTPAAY